MKPNSNNVLINKINEVQKFADPSVRIEIKTENSHYSFPESERENILKELNKRTVNILANPSSIRSDIIRRSKDLQTFYLWALNNKGIAIQAKRIIQDIEYIHQLRLEQRKSNYNEWEKLERKINQINSKIPKEFRSDTIAKCNLILENKHLFYS